MSGNYIRSISGMTNAHSGKRKSQTKNKKEVGVAEGVKI